MRDSYDPGGYRMARGWRYTKLSLPSALFLSFSGMSLSFFFYFIFHVLVGVPLIFSCSAVVVV